MFLIKPHRQNKTEKSTKLGKNKMEFEDKNIKNLSFCSLLIEINFEILHEIYPTNKFLNIEI